MAQPLQHPFRVVVVDRNGEPRPRVVWPAYERRYDQDRQWLQRVEAEGGPPCDTEPSE